MSQNTSSPCLVPFVAGTGLWIGATALLLEDAMRSGHLSVSNALMPALTMGTVLAAVYAHRNLKSWRPISGLMFLLLAILGSLATVYGTLGRQAETDLKQADAMAENRTLSLKDEELKQARVNAKKECASMGPKCSAWNARVDSLTKEMSSLRAVAVDPRADAIHRLATLLGLDGNRVRATVQAIDPLVLPLFLELGSILFFSVAFPIRKQTIAQPLQPAIETIAQPLHAATVSNLEKPHRREQQLSDSVLNDCARTFTKEEAQQDLRRLREAGSGRYLAARWGRDPATVSRWLAEWTDEGTIARRRQGKTVKAIAQVH